MPNLKPGAITIDLVDGSIHGDLGTWPKRAFNLLAITADRERHWHTEWYSHLVGSIHDGQVSLDTAGKVDHYRSPIPQRITQSSSSSASVAERSRPKEPPIQPKLL